MEQLIVIRKGLNPSPIELAELVSKLSVYCILSKATIINTEDTELLVTPRDKSLDVWLKEDSKKSIHEMEQSDMVKLFNDITSVVDTYSAMIKDESGQPVGFCVGPIQDNIANQLKSKI